jgi:hypothetical protein
MEIDHFESSKLSLVLAWVFCVPLLLGIANMVFTAFKKHEEIPWIYSAWIAVCFLILSPARYIAFLLVMAESYPFQNIAALFSLLTFWHWLPAAVAFTVAYTIGLIGPLFLVLWVVGDKANPSRVRLLISAALAPVIAFVGTFAFSLILPFAALSVHALDADAIIKATNGPAHFVFLSEGSGMIALPPYYAKTPQTTTDMIRSHVALLYLSDEEHNYFLKMEYPNLYDEYRDAVLKL